MYQKINLFLDINFRILKFSLVPRQALLTEEENLLIINRLHQVLRPFMLRRLKHKVGLCFLVCSFCFVLKMFDCAFHFFNIKCT